MKSVFDSNPAQVLAVLGLFGARLRIDKVGCRKYYIAMFQYGPRRIRTFDKPVMHLTMSFDTFFKFVSWTVSCPN